MVADLERRLGIRIDRAEVGHVDFLRDVAFVKVYYELREGEGGSIDTLTKASRFVE